MMRTPLSLVSGAALLLTAGLIGCTVDTDPFDTLSTTLTQTTVGDGDGDGDGTETGTASGDGDGDGDPATGDGDGDGDACPVGTMDCPCDNFMCEGDLVCLEGTCQPMGGDGDGDPTTTTGDGDPYDPNMCMAPGMPIGVDGIEGGFCSYVCMSDPDCPAGPPGTMGACVLQTPDMMTYCALVCDPNNDTCAAGSTCKEVPMQPGVGLCTYP